MWPDRRLKQKVQPIEKIDENVEKIAISPKDPRCLSLSDTPTA